MAFSKVTFITLIRECGNGELLHFYDQGADPRLNMMDLTRDGWCHGMSVKWLIFKKQKGITTTSFWQWVESKEAGPAFRFLMVDQAIRGKIGDDTDVDEKTIAHLRRKGPLAHLADHAKWGTNPPIESVATDIVGTPGNFARIGLYFQGGGGHALAACIQTNSIWFMDPNAGEVNMDKASFGNFLKKFWALRYPTTKIKSYYVEKYNG